MARGNRGFCLSCFSFHLCGLHSNTCTLFRSAEENAIYKLRLALAQCGLAFKPLDSVIALLFYLGIFHFAEVKNREGCFKLS